MVHLVTGYAGFEHIKSEDQGSFNASLFGKGQFVMETGKQIKAEIIDNNTVRVFDGDILMQGRHIRIAAGDYEDTIITTGTAGKDRIDLICLTYEKDTSDGTEKAYIEVIKGVETEGKPTIPEYINSDILSGAEKNQMPLYKVTILGVVLSDIACLFKTIPTYAKILGDKSIADIGDGTITGAINELNTEVAVCPISSVIKNIVVVSALPSDAAKHTDTLYLVTE